MAGHGTLKIRTGTRFATAAIAGGTDAITLERTTRMAVALAKAISGGLLLIRISQAVVTAMPDMAPMTAAIRVVPATRLTIRLRVAPSAQAPTKIAPSEHRGRIGNGCHKQETRKKHYQHELTTEPP